MNGRIVTVLLVASVTGCAYYNGLYNANRLADEARRAEREGRTGEARSLWSRAAVKAESVATRFPESKWRDDALLLQGQALYHIAACTQAAAPLAVATDSSSDPAIRRAATLTLARCRLQMAEPDAVLRGVDPVIAGGDASARAEAYLLRGRARLAVGDLPGALQDLDSSGLPAARFPIAVTLARLGRPADATARLDVGFRGPYQEAAWLATLDTVGSHDPAAVTGVVEALGRRSDLTSGQRARLFLRDGERQLGVNREAAKARFAAAAAEVPDSTEGRAARAHLAVQRTNESASIEEVQSVVDSLRGAMRLGGEAAQVGGRHLRVLERSVRALGTDGLPLALFVAAEDTRDSLRAVGLAAALFLEVAARDSGDVLSPKALLAAAALNPARADSLVAVVRSRFGSSVYALALIGEGGERYRAVEDSLQTVLAAIHGRPGDLEDETEAGDRNRSGTNRQTTRQIRQ